MGIELSEEARLARNAYLRQWRKDHPENVRRNAENFYLRKANSLGKPPTMWAGAEPPEAAIPHDPHEEKGAKEDGKEGKDPGRNTDED